MELCNICGGCELTPVAGYARLARVSSDCKPVPPGGSLAVCGTCGGVQKSATSLFLAEIARIYRDYDVYYQGGGAEQMTRDQRNGQLKRRSELLASRLAEAGALNGSGKVLDFGCGNGATLAAIGFVAPGVTLNGTDLDNRYRAQLERIPRFGRFYVAGEDALPDANFDLITMIHALEHLAEPVKMLRDLASKLKPGGKLFIESPNLLANPFDLLIADHSTHFTPRSVTRLLHRAEFRVASIHIDWVSKELSVLATPGDGMTEEGFEDAGVASAMSWIGSVAARARSLAASGPIAVFGTSIASTWLSSELGPNAVALYVDEDPARQGRQFFSKPVVAPGDVPNGLTVFVCLAPPIAEQVAARMRSVGLKCEI